MIEYQGHQITAKQFLKRFKKLDLLIAFMGNQLNDLKRKATKCTSYISVTGVRTSGVSDRVGNNVAKYVDLQKKMNHAWDEYINMKADILSVIEKIPNYDELIVLNLHYCKDMTFCSIALKMCYCERSVKYIHRNALISFEQAYKSLHSFEPVSVL